MRTSPVKNLLDGRSALIEFLAAAILIALSVNLISSAIVEHTPHILTISLALFSLFLGLFIIFRKSVPSRNIHKEISGFLVANGKTDQIINIPRYDYGETLKCFTDGLFAENAALKSLWDKDPLYNSISAQKDGKLAIRKTEACKLVVEATEYYLLDKLSTHLKDYFNKSEFNSEYLRNFSREDVADIVINNRFIENFSRPMHEREVFMGTPDIPNKAGVIAHYGITGILYSKFDLILPLGAKVRRTSHGTVHIDTPKFNLAFSVEFSGFNTNLPAGFSEFYLREMQSEDFRPYEIDISIDVNFKTWSLISKSGWDYYAWLDSFLHDLESGFDKVEFFRAIEWEVAATVASILGTRTAERMVNIE